MNETEGAVARHYGTPGLLERIRQGLRASGVDPDHLAPGDLKPVDEFHIGGVQATDDLIAQLDVDGDADVLDIGCGIGGTSRHLAERPGCKVTGVDLTPEYVACATALSAAAGLDEATAFVAGSATDLPLADNSFDLALPIHVGMNIADKPAVAREARRVLRDGGTFAIYEVMRTGAGEIRFPVPWAETAETSFVETPESDREAARDASFELASERNRCEFALDFFAALQARAAGADGPPPVGLHLLMGPTAGVKIENMVSNIRVGRFAPVEMVLKAAA